MPTDLNCFFVRPSNNCWPEISASWNFEALALILGGAASSSDTNDATSELVQSAGFAERARLEFAGAPDLALRFGILEGREERVPTLQPVLSEQRGYSLPGKIAHKIRRSSDRNPPITRPSVSEGRRGAEWLAFRPPPRLAPCTLTRYLYVPDSAGSCDPSPFVAMAVRLFFVTLAAVAVGSSSSLSLVLSDDDDTATCDFYTNDTVQVRGGRRCCAPQ